MRGSLRGRVFRGLQRFLEVFKRFSEVLRGFQRFSEVFRGFQRFSEVFRGPLGAPLRVSVAGPVAPNRVAP